MVESSASLLAAAALADDADTDLQQQLFPEHFFDAASFVAPEFPSLIDRYY